MALNNNAFEAMYVPADDTPWFPYGESGCEARVIHTDPTTGRWVVKLRGPAGGNLGIHRHYGSVFAYTLHGAWHYLEHAWVARAGDIVQETPGSVHTLELVDASEILFLVDGALEYLDSAGNTLAHEDWRSIIDKHLKYCASAGVDSVDVTRPRTSGPDRIAAR
jgi:2,4'-dihydroxyacetophenone dioxygenase